MLTSFLLGLLATTTPCVLPLYPGFLAYLSGQTAIGSGRPRYFLGLFVLIGVLTMMLALAGLIALLSVSIASMLAFIIPLANFLILLLGILLLSDRNPFRSLPQIRVPVLRHPLVNAYLYGLLYGPIALPCSGPLLVAIFAVSLTAGEALSKLWIFLWFGLGFGMPLVILSLLSGALQRRLTTLFADHSRMINIFGGLLLIGRSARTSIIILRHEQHDAPPSRLLPTTRKRTRSSSQSYGRSAMWNTRPSRRGRRGSDTVFCSTAP